MINQDNCKDTLGRLILALVKFCDFGIFRFSVYFNLANSWKISELKKMVSDMVFSECDSTCVKLKRVTTCMKIFCSVSKAVPEWKVPCGTNFPVV